ncbi:ABC transporter substrate-binding protein [Xanthobacter sp. KR7-225]|uniref:ABC transporter substrate-binding protein n=1 Tax=Xanthobacter sp. KR7-225 TaxID=3156613 RepID=UPI0032B39EDB
MQSLLSRRHLLAGMAALGGSLALCPRLLRAAPQSGLEVLGAPNASTIVLVRLMQTESFAAAAPGASFRLWRDTDDLRAGIVSGRTKLFTTPTHVPANLANRGLPLKLLCLLSMGHLSVVTADESITSFKDLAGKPVLGFFRNDMPDLVFRAIARREGMDPDKDMTLTYVQTPMEAAQLLAAGRATTAVLSEPPATAAIMMARKEGRALRRAISLQAEWKRLYGGDGIPMAGVAVHESLLAESPGLMAALRQGMVPAKDWVLQDRAAAAALAEEKMQMKAQMFSASFDHFHVVAVGAKPMQGALVAFYEAILQLAPDALGGKLPPNTFYLDL